MRSVLLGRGLSNKKLSYDLASSNVIMLEMNSFGVLDEQDITKTNTDPILGQ